MSIDLNHPLRKKTPKRKSFYSQIISRLGLFLLFCTFIVGLSIYILISHAFVGTISEMIPYSVIREIAPIPLTIPLNIEDKQSPSKRDNNTVCNQLKNDSSQHDGQIQNDISGKTVVNKPTRSTSIDSLPTIEERLILGLSKKELLAKNKVGREDTEVPAMDKNFCSNASGASIAIVVSGLGISQTGTQRAINLLPANITLAFASNGNSLDRWMKEAKKKGQEAILQIPMQAFDESYNEDDSYTLKVTQTVQQLLNRLRYSLRRGTGYFGVMNYRGAMLLSNKESAEVIFKEFAKRGLLFFDDGSSPRNLTRVLAPKLNLPYMVADLYLDDQVDRDKIREKLKGLEEIARTTGQAIGVAVAFDESIEVISQWLQQEHVRDVSVVPLSCLAKLSSPSS
ncbi:divergent polysaccharide deacetylase family protein [Candidatus Liberibacter asiaticus]